MSDIYPLSPHHAASQAIGTTISFRSGITAVPRRADVPDHMDKRIRGLRPLPGNIKIIVCAVRIVAMLYCVQRTAYSGECLYSVQVPNMTQAVAPVAVGERRAHRRDVTSSSVSVLSPITHTKH